jgi:hypothetical protein
MSAPSILTITFTDSTTVTIPIPQALQSLDSSGAASSVDQLVRSIFRAGVFTDGKTWYSAYTVKTIVAS